MSEPFVLQRRVQFAETDMAGVLHFAGYYRMMEEVEHAYWRSHDLSVMVERDGVYYGWPRVATSCEYYAPARFEDELELSLSIENVGRGSVTYEVVFRREQKRIAVGRTTAVCCSIRDASFQAVEIPGFLRSILTAGAEDKV
jgi:acyl-CoA thioester hydrolase